MSTEPRVLGVIPARGGSRGILRKNLALVDGVPLVVHAIRQAAAASTLTRTVVSTEDEEIAQVARDAGGDVPFLRPTDLAEDATPTLPVLLHALTTIEAAGDARYEWVCILQPTAPLRRADDIDRAVRKAIATGADSVVTVCRTHHPAKTKRIEDDQLLPYVVVEAEGTRRQDLGETAWRRNGAVYVMRRDVLDSGRLYGDTCRPVEMPAERSVDVDLPADLILVNALWQTLDC